MKTKLRKQQGFTIIEVLIVLAIAGLILLIVFLAVPALQRNSRNTQRTSDISRALGAAQEVLNNNNGDLTKLDSGSLQAVIGNLSYYTLTDITVAAAAPPGPGVNTTTVDKAILYKGAKCSGTLAVPGTTRQLAITFTVEAAAKRCTDS